MGIIIGAVNNTIVRHCENNVNMTATD